MISYFCMCLNSVANKQTNEPICTPLVSFFFLFFLIKNTTYLYKGNFILILNTCYIILKNVAVSYYVTGKTLLLHFISSMHKHVCIIKSHIGQHFLPNSQLHCPSCATKKYSVEILLISALKLLFNKNPLTKENNSYRTITHCSIYNILCIFHFIHIQCIFPLSLSLFDKTRQT